MTGATATEVAASLGLSVHRVRKCTAQLLSGGEIPPVKLRRRPELGGNGAKPPRFRAYPLGRRFGRIDEMLAQLTPKQAAWLVNQVPPDGLLTDVVRAIIIDAYNEEHP